MTVEFHTAIAPHRFFIPRKQLYKLKLTAFLKLRKERKKRRGRQRDINCKMPKPRPKRRNKIPSWVFHHLWDRDAESTAPEASRSLGFADISALKHHRFNRNKSPFLYEDVKIFCKPPQGMKLDQTSGQCCTKQIPPTPRFELAQSQPASLGFPNHQPVKNWTLIQLEFARCSLCLRPSSAHPTPL